ncbi:MAG: hypothetical protein NTU66_04450 [Elusimicrobia bacterium]|nr:hypothetical protein [Elusimicrobiota bacterium]
MKNRSFLFSVVALVCFSAGMYGVQYAVFHDTHDMVFYFLQDLAFLPISVIMVTFIIDQMMSRRQKKQILEKMNFVVGVFYSELGKKLLATFGGMNKNTAGLCAIFAEITDWSDTGIRQAARKLEAHDYAVTFADAQRLDEVRQFLLQKRGFMVQLLENANLLEHETFTNLLMSTFHLMEELTERLNTAAISADDWKHIENDARRVYAFLAIDWLQYLKHLNANYPYLFKFALATNPLK